MQDGIWTPRKSSLNRFKIFEAGGAEALSAALTPLFGPTVVEPAPGSRALQARVNICRLKKMAVGYGSFDQAFGMKVAHSTSFTHGFPVRGRGEHVNNGMVIEDSPQRGAVGAPGPMSLSYGPNFEIFAIFMTPEALSSTLSGLVGSPQNLQLKLDKSNYDSRPEAPAVRRLVQLMIAELDSEVSSLSPLVLTELEQAISVAFLCGVDHNYSRLLDGRPPTIGSRDVRRVEEYVESNWDEPITVEALALIANASVRSIFRSFRLERGWSPMSFVKHVRLTHAKKMLGSSTPGTSVTSVAFACGFGNLGHFAHDYQQKFGETPSATLNRSNFPTR